MSARIRNAGVTYVIRGLSLLLVFFLRELRFSDLLKEKFPNSMQSRTVEKEPICECASTESLFIYLFIYSFDLILVYIVIIINNTS